MTTLETKKADILEKATVELVTLADEEHYLPANYTEQILSDALYSYRDAVVSGIGESHNLDTGYKGEHCDIVSCVPQWDGNYYTCRYCGKEFVKKDNILQSLK